MVSLNLVGTILINPIFGSLEIGTDLMKKYNDRKELEKSINTKNSKDSSLEDISRLLYFYLILGLAIYVLGIIMLIYVFNKIDRINPRYPNALKITSILIAIFNPPIFWILFLIILILPER